MRLPRRIFLNVVIFVSSFLVVSYHKTAQCTCRALQPELFTLLLSHTPFKKKNKIFTSNCAVCSNTGGVFFGGRRGCYPAHIFCRSGAAGVGIRGTVFYRLYCYRRHSLPGSLFYTGCYPAHNSGEPALESPAQFTAGGVVIGSTISVRCASRGKKNGCYRTHNSDFFLRAAGCYPQHNLRGG